MKPLAYRIRPKVFEDIVGQDHLVGPTGVIRKMMDANQLCSMILYGPAGCGKTSIAEIIASHYALNSYSYNASCDTKAKLKEIAEAAKLYQNVILIIDEIHRMKKDVQDFFTSLCRIWSTNHCRTNNRKSLSCNKSRHPLSYSHLSLKRDN